MENTTHIDSHHDAREATATAGKRRANKSRMAGAPRAIQGPTRHGQGDQGPLGESPHGDPKTGMVLAPRLFHLYRTHVQQTEEVGA